MQGTIQNYALDMADGKKNAPLRVKQYDTNSRWARISLTAFGEPWPVPAGCRACIAVKKTDGTRVLNDCTVEGSNTVLAPITDQTTAVQGIQQAELYFLAVDGDIKSQTFPINVYPAIMDQRVIESSNEFGTLQTAIIGAQEATRTAQDAASEAMVQAGEAREAAEIAIDAAASIDEAVQAAAAAKTSETNAKASETAAAQSKADVEAMKAAFAGYNKVESSRKYANALTTMKEGDGQVTVTDAWEAPVVSLEVDGASEQVATTGAQLFDVKSVIYRNNVSSVKDITKTDTGVKFTTVIFGNSTGIFCENTITYSGVCTISGDIVVSSKDFNKINIRFGDPNTAKQIDASEFINNKVHFSMTGELKDDKTLTLYVNNADKTKPITVEFANIMIAKGDTAQPWEPYTGGKPSPSPDYPQEIVSVAHVANSGANLFDYTQIPTKTEGGITFKNNGDGSFLVNGTATLYASARLPLSLIPGTYIASGTIGDVSFFVRIYTNDDDYVGYVNDFVITGNEYKVMAFIQVANGKTVNETVRPMLNAGSTPQPWEPYNGQQREIDLEVESRGVNLFDVNGVGSFSSNGTVKIENNELYFTSSGGDSYFGKATPKGEGIAPNIGKLNPIQGGTRIMLVLSNDWFDKKYFTFWDSYGISLGYVPANGEVDVPLDAVAYTIRCGHYETENKGSGTYRTRIQVQYASDNTTFYPYRYQKVTIPLAEPLRGIGDVKDRFCLRGGVWGIERKITSILYDGIDKKANKINALWDANFPGYTHMGLTQAANWKIGQKSFLSELFICTTEENRNYKSISLACHTSTDDLYLFITNEMVGITESTNNTGKINAVDAWIREHNFTVTYELATPTWEPFPESTQAALNALTTHPGTTYLTVTSTDVAAPVRLTYVQDTRKVIDALQLDVAEQMIELQAQIDQLKVTNNLA